MSYYYCGAKVLGVNMSLGWNDSSTNITISLAEDPIDPIGNDFLEPTVGSPSTFALGGFIYHGIVKSWMRDNSSNGFRVEVNLTDPKDILDVPVILSGNYFPPSMQNVLNPFGYLENVIGFGGSQANSSGMPWKVLISALNDIFNLSTVYGSPIIFGNTRYIVDFGDSGLIGCPTYYRVGGTTQSMTIKDLLNYYCEDAGLDYFCYLTPPAIQDGPWIIKIKTVSRRYAPPLGTISAYVNQNTGNILNNGNGIEWAAQVTGTYVTGGYKTDLYLASDIRPFWGKDVDGNIIQSEMKSIYCPNWPILLTNPELEGTDGIPVKPQGWTFFNNGKKYAVAKLNAAPIARYIGSVEYEVDELELRAARAGMGTWKNYVSSIYPYKAAAIGPIGLVSNICLFKHPKEFNDFLSWTENHLAAEKDLAAADSFQAEAEISVYNFVRMYADEFYGKKFLVGIPFTLNKTDSETGIVSYSHEPTEAGWYEDPGALGLTREDSYLFRTNDERYSPFAYFSNTLFTDKERINPADVVCYNEKMYLKCNIANQIVNYGGAPYVLVTLNNPIYQINTDAVGVENDLKENLNTQAPALDFVVGGIRNAVKAINQQLSQVLTMLSPPAIVPSVIAVPLKSNIGTYGPWKASTSTYGKVKYEQDESLTPWSFGSTAAMNQAANAKIWNGLSTLEFVERGKITRAGIPLVSLGDEFVSQGPCVTSMNVSISRDGVTTSYDFRTFSPKLNAPDKAAIDRIRKIGLATQKLRRDIVVNIKRNELAKEARSEASSARRARLPNWQRRETPHDVILAKVTPQLLKEDGTSTTDKRLSVGTVQVLEGRMVAAYNDIPDSVAMTSLSTVLRPYSTYQNEYMPSILSPTGNYGLKSTDFLQIVKSEHDIEVGTQGNGNGGWNQYRSVVDSGKQRSIGYFANNCFIGWGYDFYDQKLTRNTDGSDISGLYRQTNAFHAGPLHLLWDRVQGVWSSHDVAIGITNAAISGGQSGVVTLYNGTSKMTHAGNDVVITAHIWFTGASVDSGKRVMLNYVQHANKWYIAGADC